MHRGRVDLTVNAGEMLVVTSMTLCTQNLPLEHFLCPLLRKNPLAFLLRALGSHATLGLQSDLTPLCLVSVFY